MKEIKMGLAGNPNVGKSTIFNSLTHSNQHTGNWAGKTVENAVGIMKNGEEIYKIYDLPGIYSLLPHSEEERVARDFLVFDDYDFVMVVCDASSLLRNLNLVLQMREMNCNLILCLNLIDEARKKKIEVNSSKLEKLLGVKIIECCAHDNKSIKHLHDEIIEYSQNIKRVPKRNIVKYPAYLEKAIQMVVAQLQHINLKISKRWLALNIIRNDRTIIDKINSQLGTDIMTDEMLSALYKIKKMLLDEDVLINEIDDVIVNAINDKASSIYEQVVTSKRTKLKELYLDKILTSKLWGIPIMLLFLGIIFLITIKISNYPSEWLFKMFSSLEVILNDCLIDLGLPSFLIDMLINGVYKVTTWVISVMLPPMMIFFPLFTLLEDFGYLPRIAFNLDGVFRKCSSCGKQSLTMAMGFGCNCVGVTGARIIDSKRERLIAILTNTFIPCNGKFPTIIAIITMFFVGLGTDLKALIISTLILLLIVLLGVLMTFIVSKLLSKTLFAGYPSSFILELTPFRRPRIMKTIVTSIFDRTLFVLGRAVTVAIPAGFIIWILANINIGDLSILNHLTSFFDPFGKIFGVDGVIIVAFLLGFPANEIVLPIMLMCYLNTGTLVDYSNLLELKTLLIDNGWTILTALSVVILFIMHYPCSTACLTIKKETGSWWYVFLSCIIPTILGLLCCFIINLFLGPLV